ncbi:HAD family hydrolase [uncultured Jatrophihabitans sp.]|uniref:HAD family hydrolase n=1 Tax=uncultured Jatrophihabitans sp. TaxID=1610747 RepID=UPI0035CB9D6B
MIDAVLFDFGGVVIDSPFEAFAQVEQRCGVPAGTVRRINSASPDTSAWAQLERGEITPDRFVELFGHEAAALGVALDGHQLLEALRALPTTRGDARPAVITRIDELRAAGIRVGLLTNNIAPMDGTDGTRWVFDAFDRVLESCRLGVRKPEPRIYELACAALDAPPQRAVLLDDLGINLKPARALGLHTIKVGDPDDALAELTEIVDVS